MKLADMLILRGRTEPDLVRLPERVAAVPTGVPAGSRSFSCERTPGCGPSQRVLSSQVLPQARRQAARPPRKGGVRWSAEEHPSPGYDSLGRFTDGPDGGDSGRCRLKEMVAFAEAET